MTDQTTDTGTRSRAPQPTPPPTQATGWVGWVMFAAVMMVIIGVLHAIQGLVAIFDDEYYLVTDNGLTIEMDYTAWGWTHLVLGLIVLSAGVSLFTGSMWARVVGVAVASISILLNFAFIAAYPFWSTIAIAIDVFVIWALTVHGSEVAAAQGAERY